MTVFKEITVRENPCVFIDDLIFLFVSVCKHLCSFMIWLSLLLDPATLLVLICYLISHAELKIHVIYMQKL
jgi:hypothetical protein